MPEDVKQRRLSEVIDTFHSVARAKAQHEVGKTHVVLVEGVRSALGVLRSLSL